ncbi:MAG TPA: hypothetical protein VN637_08680 [Roseiarcus sp.]|nr:hypothetical protein [Roseiarcus sp.]
MFDVVAPDKHQLALPVEAECVDQSEPRLAGSSARNAQPASERQPVKNRQNDECGDAASGKESDLKDAIVRERKAIQPLHAQSRISALAGRDQKLFEFCLPNEGGFACAGDAKSPGSATSRPAASPRARTLFEARPSSHS